MRYAFINNWENLHNNASVRDAIKKSCKEHLEREMIESILNEKISRLPNARATAQHLDWESVTWRQDDMAEKNIH